MQIASLEKKSNQTEDHYAKRKREAGESKEEERRREEIKGRKEKHWLSVKEKKKKNKSYSTFVRVHDLMGRVDFPGRPSGKEPACNAGDWSLIPELGRSLGGGNGSQL